MRLKKCQHQANRCSSQDPAFIEWKKTTSPSRHQLNHALYEKVKNELSQLASERGYLDAHFTQKRHTAEQTENQADIQLTFDSGKQYRA